MRIAVPVDDGSLSMHFGHCREFALFDVDAANKAILRKEIIAAPPHQPGLLPGWLAERLVSLVIAGGMGHRAKGLFNQNGIEVITGAAAALPEKLIEEYLAGTLEVGPNACDH